MHSNGYSSMYARPMWMVSILLECALVFKFLPCPGNGYHFSILHNQHQSVKIEMYKWGEVFIICIKKIVFMVFKIVSTLNSGSLL